MGIQINAAAKAAGGVEDIASRRRAPPAALKRNEQLVYDALHRSETPLKAYDLLDSLQDQGLRAPMTIYRALEALIAKGHVKKIASLNAFIIVNPDRAALTSAFLICRKCMRAKEITLSEKQVAELFAPLSICVDDVLIEAFTDCRQVCGDDD